MPEPIEPHDDAHSRDAAVARIVMRFLKDLDSGLSVDVEQLCAASPHLQPALKEQLHHAARVREARVAARAYSTNPHSLGADWAAVPLPDSSPEPSLPRQLDQYSIVRQIGGGGFGRVFEARSRDNAARYAIKVLKPEYTSDAEFVARFKAEARFAQQLCHPGIVEILAHGQSAGLHYLVMPLIEGPDLHQHTGGKPLAPQAAAALIIPLARACAFAHTAGVIHRDLKPANILVETATGRARITDFGLAKQLGEATFLTESLQRIGTLHYMAPEQANRRLGPIGPATDVYALGGTLYYLLTGRPPFPKEPGAGREATLRQIEWEAPLAPSAVNKDVPRDLEIICLKCLAKFPIDRYASASDLAADLERFRAGQRLETSLPGPIRRARRWARRRPILASLAGALLISLCGGAALSVHFAGRASVAEDAAGTASEEKRAAVEGMKVAIQENELTANRLKLEQYLVDMRRAADHVRASDLPRARQLLDTYLPDSNNPLRGVEWRLLRALASASSDLRFGAPGDTWNQVTLDPTGTTLIAVDDSGVLAAWDIPSGAERLRVNENLRSVAFSANGDLIVALAADGTAISLWDHARWSAYPKIESSWASTALAISPDGTRMVVGDLGAHMYMSFVPSGTPYSPSPELTIGHRRGLSDTSLDIQHGEIRQLAFTPDGSSVVVGYSDGAAQSWSIDDRRLTARLAAAHTGPIAGIAVSPSGVFVATQSIGDIDIRSTRFLPGELKVWERATGQVVWENKPHTLPPNFPPQPTRLLASDPRVVYPSGQFAPAFSADGESVYSTGDQGIRVWNTRTGDPGPDIKLEDSAAVIGVATARSSSAIAALAADHSIRVKRQGATDLIATIATTSSPIVAFEASPDGSRLAAISLVNERIRLVGGPGGDRIQSGLTGDYVAQAWNASTGEHLGYTGRFYERSLFFSFSRCLTHFECFSAFPRNIEQSAEGISDPMARIEFARALRPAACDAVLHLPDDDFHAIRVSLTGAEPVEVLAVADLSEISSLAFSPRGSLAAVGFATGRVALISLAPERVALHSELPLANGPVTALRFSHSGSLVARGSQDGSIALFDTADASPRAVFTGHRERVSGFAFTAGDHRLISCSGAVSKDGASPGSISIWDTASGALCMQLPAPDRCAFTGVALAPDDLRLYAAATHVDARASDAKQSSILVWHAPIIPR